MKKPRQIVLTKQAFDEMEISPVQEVTSLTKSLIETFKFRMLLDSHIAPEHQEKTSVALKAFRKKAIIQQSRKD